MAKISRVGNRTPLTLQQDRDTHHFGSFVGKPPCLDMEHGYDQPSCRVLDNFADPSLQVFLGSSHSGRAHTVTYLPVRSFLTPKVKGGGLLPKLGAEAPSSSTSKPVTSKPVPNNGAIHGTSGSQALAQLFLDMELDHPFLEAGQTQLLNYSQQDLQQSFQDYLKQPSKDQGQQLLADLQRLERLVYRQ